MQVFSLRAKNQTEVSRFARFAASMRISLSNLTSQADAGAVEVEFSSTAKLPQLQELALEAGGSMMRGTLRDVARHENPMTYGMTPAYA